MFRIGKSIETKSKSVVARGWSKGGRESANKFGFSLEEGSNKNALKLNVGGDCTIL
jgi:hypothetical protein